ADTLEAVLGAIYLQYGLGRASAVVHKLFDPVLADAAQRGAGLDWKTSLQELTAAFGLGVPEYAVSEEGPDHAKSFTAVARVGGCRRCAGAASTCGFRWPTRRGRPSRPRRRCWATSA